MEKPERKIDQIALNLQYGGFFDSPTVSRVIEAHVVVICDVAVELGRPDLQAQFAEKISGLPSIMHSIKTLEDIYPNISPYIAQRVQNQLDMDKLV